MATIKNNENYPIDCRSINKLNCILACGDNIGFTSDTYLTLKNHPTLLSLLETNKIEFYKEDTIPEGTRLGLNIVEDRKTGENYPVTDEEFRSNLGNELPLGINKDKLKQNKVKAKVNNLIKIDADEIANYKQV